MEIKGELKIKKKKKKKKKKPVENLVIPAKMYLVR